MISESPPLYTYTHTLSFFLYSSLLTIGLLLEGVYETIPVIYATLPEMLQATSLFRPELLQYTFSPSNLSYTSGN